MSDFIAPKASGKTDYIGVFAVSAGFGMGFGCEDVGAELRRQNDQATYVGRPPLSFPCVDLG